MTSTGTSYIKAYLEDPNVKEWYQTLRLRSASTAMCYLKDLARIWRMTDMSPMAFVKGSQLVLDKRGQRVMTELHAHVQTNGERLSEETLKKFKSSMRSWLHWNGRKFDRQPIIGRAPRRPKARKQFIPTPVQLRTVKAVASIRTRVCVNSIAFGGLRPHILGDHEGENGLMVQNISGLAVVQGRYEVESLPLRVEVPDELSKAGFSFLTFWGGEAAEDLVAYLNSRIEDGEDVGPESPIIGYEKGAMKRHAKRKFLDTKRICELMRIAHRRAGLALPPYIWRSYFDTQLLLAESKGLVVRDYRQFWMGHTGDIEAQYTVRKCLSVEILEDMEQRYMAAIKLLETRRTDEEDNGAQSVVLAFLGGIGCTEDEIAAVDFDNPDPVAIKSLVDAKVAALIPTAPEPAPTAVVAPQGPQQRIVDADDVETWLEQGWTWEYNAPLPPGKALVNAPSPLSADETWTAPAAASVPA